MNKTVVILSSGLATRLYPITQVIPKCMVNYRNHTLLKHLYKQYKQLGADRIVTVVHSKFKSLVESYCKQENIDVEVVTVDDALGSAYAISRLELTGNVVFNWSDVIPVFGETFTWNVDAIYTHGDSSRFMFTNNPTELSKRADGNVVGVYQVKDFQQIKSLFNFKNINLDPSVDFVEFLPIEQFTQIELFSAIDIGDYYKLVDAHTDMTVSREFNTVTIDESTGTVSKYALNETGKNLQATEIMWYMLTRNANCVPDLLEYHHSYTGQNKLVLEYVDGSTLYNHPGLQKDPVDMVTRVLELSKSFSTESFYPSKGTLYNDFKRELIDKTLERCHIIQPVINSIPYHIRTVNGVTISKDIGNLCRKVYDTIMKSQSDTKYTVIHGDLNFSNILVESNTGKLKFIDPRGYFGHTKLYGPRIYDEAKVLYALTGYDEFNALPDWNLFTIDGENLQIHIQPLVDINKVKHLFTDEHHLLVAIIWLNLAGYFKNNPLKAFIAYYYGLYLLTVTTNEETEKWLNEKLSVEPKHLNDE